MKNRFVRSLFAAGILGAGVVIASGADAIASGASDADPLTFTVGVTQDIDSLNVTVGYLVIDYEIWNLTLPTLTDKAADDFATTPGLAESWEGSDDGLTWTYTLREGMKWSDGEPLTADDIVYTITRANEEEWTNHYSTTKNLTATAPDDRTVVVTSAVPDPKLPTLDFYVVPKHIYETISAEDLPNYPADDNVSGGPFRITERQEGEFVRLEQNPNWYGEQPNIDQVIFQVYATPEAQFTALEAGDIDSLDDMPTALYADVLNGEFDNLVAIGGSQGSFSQIAMNTGCPTGIGDGHPALQDKLVRQAINWAIDRELLVEKVLNGTGEPAYAPITSANPKFDLQIPEGTDVYSYDPERAKALLDEAGWVDDDGDGVRAKDGIDLRLRYFDRSDGDGTAPTPFITEWLNDVGIGTDVTTVTNDVLIELQSKSEFDLYTWGWTPFVDPDPMLSYFTTAEVPTDPEVGGYNDGNWCNEEYDALYAEQQVELDPDKRADLIQQMLLLFYEEAPYAVYYKYDELQAIRSDRWENFVHQPAETGPVLFTNTSPAYIELQSTTGSGDDDSNTVPTSTGSGDDDSNTVPTSTGGGDDDSNTVPTSTGSGDDDSNTALIVGIAVGAVAVIGVGLFVLLRSRKKSDDDRE